MIAPELIDRYQMNDEQRTIISHKKGPLLVVAGPGSGKTHSLVLLAMNLLLCDNAKPSELVLCTYTEKAAYEIRYEAANRPTWLSLPVRGLAALASRLLGDTGTPPHDPSTQAPGAATPPNPAEGDYE